MITLALQKKLKLLTDIFLSINLNYRRILKF